MADRWVVKIGDVYVGYGEGAARGLCGQQRDARVFSDENEARAVGGRVVRLVAKRQAEPVDEVERLAAAASELLATARLPTCSMCEALATRWARGSTGDIEVCDSCAPPRYRITGDQRHAAALRTLAAILAGRTP